MQINRTHSSSFLLIAFIILTNAELPSSARAQDLTRLSSDQQRNAKQAIEAILTEQTAAWNAGDLEKFMNTYLRSESLTFSSGGATTRGWQATLERYKKRYSTPELMGKLRFDQLETTLLEEKSALVLGSWHLTFADTSERHGNFSLVLTKVDNDWRIIHDHSSDLRKNE